MSLFIKAAAGVLIALILCVALSKHGKDFSLILTIAVCCMVITAGLSYWEPVIDFFERLQVAGKLDPQMLETLLKAVGIGVLTEVTSLICEDSGNASLGKAIKILASIVILWLAIPLFTGLLDLVEEVLVNI